MMRSKCSIPTYRSAVLVFLLMIFSVVRAANVTVDDASPAWTYNSSAPPGSSLSWGVISPTHTCSFCLSQPDPTQVYNHTWHDTDLANSASLTFAGISLTVYIICPGPTAQGYIYATNYTFMFDGMSDGNFHGQGCATMTYNYAVYSKSGLAPTSHTFMIINAPPLPPPNQQRSDLLLDYAIYDDGGLSSSSSSSASASSSASSSLSLSATSSSASPSSSSKSSGQKPQSHLPGISTILGIVLSSVAGVVVVG